MKPWGVSRVEAYRNFLMDEAADTKKFIHELLHGFEQSPAMLAGTAFHEAIENAEAGNFAKLEADGYTFNFAETLTLGFILPSIRELRAQKSYIVDGEPFIIAGVVDGINGNTVIEHKTTSYFDPDRYLDGYQWRLYLDIFEAHSFCWNVFELKEVGPLTYNVLGMHTMRQYRYPRLAEDCQSMVERFARFIREHVVS